MTWATVGALSALGIYHGVNPGMGWLFAVALGLQEGRSRAVWRALLPIALGHTLAIGATVVAVIALGKIVPIGALKMFVGVVLILFGLSRLIRMRHPRWAAMQVGFRQLTLWSFLMASAHGAGLMLMPWVLPPAQSPAEIELSATAHAAAPSAAAKDDVPECHQMAPADSSQKGTVWSAVLSVGVHTLGYLLAMTLVAWLVYTKLGVSILRKAWLNLEAVWACALVVAGAVAWLS